MEIGFFFKYDNLAVQLPVNPPEIKIGYVGNEKSEEIVQLGNINILKDRKLTSIKIESFFPKNQWFSAIRTNGKFKEPDFYKDFFLKIMEDKKPCRLMITGINVNMLVSITKFSYTHKAEDSEDAWFELEVTEYRPYSVLVVATAKASDTDNPIVQATPSKTTPERPATVITIGSAVTLSGRVYADSYGGGGGKTFSNYSVKVNLINKKGTHPYHVTTTGGSPLGWVTKEAVKL